METKILLIAFAVLFVIGSYSVSGKCQGFHKPCPTGQGCIHPEDFCDGVPDCKDKSDESYEECSQKKYGNKAKCLWEGEVRCRGHIGCVPKEDCNYINNNNNTLF